MSSNKLSSHFVERIFHFNREIVGVNVSTLTPLSEPEAKWLQTALNEEAQELVDATMVDLPPLDKIVEQVDACVDALIFATGGMARMGLTTSQVLQVIHAVMNANFEKKAGVKAGREGAKDAVKPEGWVGPEARIKEILSNV